MKTNRFGVITTILLTATSVQAQTPIGTTFTYQGRIKQAGNLVTNSCDFRFRLFGSAAGADQVGPELIFDGSVGNGAPISVTNGLFRADLDFGAGAFNGDKRWLEVRTRVPHGTPGDPNGYITVSPRQELTPTPYALQTRRGNALDAADGDPANALFVDANGDVGIGTTDPVNTLDVAGTMGIHGAGSYLELGPGFGQRINLFAGSVHGIGVQNNTCYFRTSTNFAWFRGGTHADAAGDPGAGGTVLAFLDFNGNLGLGTGSPSQKLHVEGSAYINGGNLNINAAGNGGVYLSNIGELAALYRDGASENGRLTLSSNATATVDIRASGSSYFNGGNVGIGTPSPNYKLEARGILGDGYGNANIVGSNDGDVIAVGIYSDSRKWELVSIVSTDADYFGIVDSTASPTGTPRLAITETGNVGIGTTNPLYRFDVFDNSANTAAAIRQVNPAGQGLLVKPGSDAFFALAITNAAENVTRHVLFGNGTAVFALGSGNVGIGTPSPGFQLTLSTNSAGKPGGGSWSDSSDIRLKQNIEPLDGALDRLLCLRGVTYEWIEPAKHGDLTGTQIGMIAQDVEEIFPEWVGTDNEGYKTLGFRGFEALTVEALRELTAENENMAGQIEDLTARLNVLEALVSRLAGEAAPR